MSLLSEPSRRGQRGRSVKVDNHMPSGARCAYRKMHRMHARPTIWPSTPAPMSMLQQVWQRRVSCKCRLQPTRTASAAPRYPGRVE